MKYTLVHERSVLFPAKRSDEADQIMRIYKVQEIPEMQAWMFLSSGPGADKSRVLWSVQAPGRRSQMSEQVELSIPWSEDRSSPATQAGIDLFHERKFVDSYIRSMAQTPRITVHANGTDPVSDVLPEVVNEIDAVLQRYGVRIVSGDLIQMERFDE